MDRYSRLLKRIRTSSAFGAVKASLEGKRLIFTVTTGRSGTALLSALLSLVPGVASLHEPDPNFALVMRRAQTNRALALKFMAYEKLVAVAGFKEPVYCETSHLFCKGFFEPTLDLGILPELILLKRDRRKVAKSLFELNTIPGRTPLALIYYLKPDDPSVFLPVEGWSHLNDYQLCYWYCLEIEKRMDVYERVLLERGGRCYRLRFEELVTPDGAAGLLERLFSLPRESVEQLKEPLAKLLERPINAKKEIKVRRLKEELPSETLAELEREVEELVGFKGVEWE
ncbi:hypothetical protein [Thermovibrio ammonificans]